VSVEPAELPRFQLYHDTGKARPGMLALAEHFYLDGPEAGECAKWLDEPKRQAIFAFSRNCQVFLVDSLERRLRVELSVPAGNVDSDALDRLLSDLDRCLDCLEQTGSDSRAAIRSE
jgi:hypothetical protein